MSSERWLTTGLYFLELVFLENWTAVAERRSILGLSLTVEPFHDGKGRDSIWSRTNLPVLKLSGLWNVRREETQQVEHYLNVWHVIFFFVIILCFAVFVTSRIFLYQVKCLMDKACDSFFFLTAANIYGYDIEASVFETLITKNILDPASYIHNSRKSKIPPWCSAGRRPREREPKSTNQGLAPRSSLCSKVM